MSCILERGRAGEVEKAAAAVVRRGAGVEGGGKGRWRFGEGV